MCSYDDDDGAHHQELESIILMVAACGIWCFGFRVVGMVWSWGLCVQFAGIMVPETCWASNKICNKNHLLHLVGILFSHINDDARSKSLQMYTATVFLSTLSVWSVNKNAVYFLEISQNFLVLAKLFWSRVQWTSCFYTLTVVPVHFMKAYEGSVSAPQLNLNCGARWFSINWGIFRCMWQTWFCR